MKILIILITAASVVVFAACMIQTNKDLTLPDPPEGYKYIQDFSFDNYGGEYVDEALYSVNVDEGDRVSTYLVLANDYGGNDVALLLRKNVTNNDGVCYKNEKAFGSNAGYYNGSDVDLFLRETFFAKFPTQLQDMIIEVPVEISSMVAVSERRGDVEVIHRKIFLISATEMGKRRLTCSVEGKKLIYFDDWKLANPATDDSGNIAIWWLRSSYLSDGIKAYHVDVGGQVGPSPIANKYGVRPVFCLPRDTLVRLSDQRVVTSKDAILS